MLLARGRRAVAAAAAQPSQAWNISLALVAGSFSTLSQDISTSGVFFRPDGSAMYVAGYAGDSVYQYGLSAGWDVTTATLTTSFSVAAKETIPIGLFFKNDGTRMYVTGNNSDSVHQYDLPSAWEVDGASFSQTAPLASTPTGVYISPDGMKLFSVHSDFSSSVREYGLASPWDIGTASFVRSVAIDANVPHGISFKPDGSKMFCGEFSGEVHEYGISTPWDITTAVHSQTLSVAAEQTKLRGVFFRPDGLKMYVSGNAPAAIHEYSLSPV